MKSYPFADIPFDRIERVGQISQLYRDLFSVSWILGRFCNYSCSYCWPYASGKTRDHQSLDKILATIDSIKSQARERHFNSFHFSFSGGEPTLHPQYLEILSYLAQDTERTNYQSVHMTTNLSAGIGWFKKYIAATREMSRVSITASFHKEFAERESFAEKLIFLQEGDVQVTVNMVMVPSRFDVLLADAEYFHSRGINVTLKPQSNSSATEVVSGYTPEQLEFLQNALPQMNYTEKRLNLVGRSTQRKRVPLAIPEAEPGQKVPYQTMQVELKDQEGKTWFLDQAERMNAFHFNRFENWICSSGYRSIVIREPGGVVKRSYSCSDKPLGSIEQGFRLFDEPRPCITRSCVSSADSKIPKKKPECALPLWPEGSV